MIKLLVHLFVVLPIKLGVGLLKLLLLPLRLLGPVLRWLAAPLRWLGRLVSHPKLFLGAAVLGAAAVVAATEDR